MRPTFIVNGIDFAKRINKFAYEVGYEKVLGNHSGIMKSGAFSEDFLKWRAVLTLTTNAMRQDEEKEFLQALKDIPLIIDYVDSSSGGVRRAWFTVEIGKNRIAFYENGKTVWKEGRAIKLTEVRDFE